MANFERTLADAYKRGGVTAALKCCDRFLGLDKPKVPTTSGKGYDSSQLKPYHLCSDGAHRTREEIAVWMRDGTDERSRLRATLQKKHCGGQCSIGGRPGHLCSCCE